MRGEWFNISKDILLNSLKKMNFHKELRVFKDSNEKQK